MSVNNVYLLQIALQMIFLPYFAFVQICISEFGLFYCP